MGYFGEAMKTASKNVPQYLISMRRDVAARLDTANSGHPKPELVAKLNTELDAFDAKHPSVRGVSHSIY